MSALSHTLLPDRESDTEQMIPLDRPYLLVINIPHFVNARGEIFLDGSWSRDFVQHLDYLPQLVLVSPRLSTESTSEKLVKFEGDPKHFLPLPPHPSMAAAIRALPKVCSVLFDAVGRADVVHAGVAGWPYPIGWLATAFARLRGKALVVVVESAPWRGFDKSKSNLKGRIRTDVYEKLAGWACRNADLALFTQSAYKGSLHKGGRGAAYVTPATWIHADEVATDAEAHQRWKRKDTQHVRLLFAGRLQKEKGIQVLLDALALLDAQGLSFACDFIGTGELESAIDRASQTLHHVKVQRLAPVPYGAPFFDLVDGYHALLVPSLSDEQPRILFDAAARAIPVIASSTDGIRPHVGDGATGRLVRPGDAENLASVIAQSLNEPECFRRYGMGALTEVRTSTHEAMHAKRSQLLAKHFPSSAFVRR